MPFGSQTLNSVVYDPRKDGLYVSSAVAFGGPTNELRVRGSSTPDKNDRIRASVTRVLEKDVVIGTATVRKPLVVSLSILVDPSSTFTSTEIDNMVSDINSFITAAVATRLMQGES